MINKQYLYNNKLLVDDKKTFPKRKLRSGKEYMKPSAVLLKEELI